MSKGYSKHYTLSAFTPVELIVLVTVIISALSLIIPLIYHSRQQAKISSCASNLSQLGRWIHLYCKTSDGYLPAYEDGWVSKLADIGNMKIDQTGKPTGEFACPSQSFESLKGGIQPGDYWRGTYYGINQHIASNLKNENDEPFPFWTQVNMKTVPDPSTKVLLADATGSNFFKIDGRDPAVAGMSMDGASFADSLPPEPAIPLPFLRHANGSGNFLFLDGHVQLKQSWPQFMKGPGTSGYYFWSGEQAQDGQ